MPSIRCISVTHIYYIYISSGFNANIYRYTLRMYIYIHNIRGRSRIITDTGTGVPVYLPRYTTTSEERNNEAPIAIIKIHTIEI